jgi:hypothetical protein
MSSPKNPERFTTALLLLTLTLSPGLESRAQVQHSSARAPCWDWSTLPLESEVTNRIHKSAKKVPAFPKEGQRFRDPTDWPMTTRIEGVRCSLRVQELGGDWVRDVRSLEEVSSKNGVCLYYEGPPWSGWGSRRGPFYCWYTIGYKWWLHERSWQSRGALGTGIYQYYRSGELYRYEGEGLNEVFDQNGCLLALRYSASYYWLGTQIGSREFYERVAKLVDSRGSPSK